MDLIVVPYHDWRKILAEGSRTRDAHFIEEFRKSDEISKLMIINRPYTWAEILLKKKKISLGGKLVFKEGNGRIYALDERTYLFDYRVNQDVLHILKGRAWYIDAYQNDGFIHFIRKGLKYLEVNNCKAVSQNVLAAKLFQHLEISELAFDAWDNFLLMPGLKGIRSLLEQNYREYASRARYWYTNSNQNIAFYTKHFKPAEIKLVKNGADMQRFNKTYAVPEDLATVPKPRLGFGGKITHLFDVELFNHLSDKNPDKSFVLVGQVLDKNVYKQIALRPNVFFLGDKHYNEYPAYVANFDLGIIPYRVGQSQHGGDSIKAYEYLAAGIKVVGTRDNGLETLEAHMYLANSPEEFNKHVQTNHNEKVPFESQQHSWQTKTLNLLDNFRK